MIYKKTIKTVFLFVCVSIIFYFSFFYSFSNDVEIFNLDSKTRDGYIELLWQTPNNYNKLKMTIEVYNDEELIEKYTCNYNQKRFIYKDGQFGEIYVFKTYIKDNNTVISKVLETSALFINYEEMPNIPLIVINTSNDKDPSYIQIEGKYPEEIGNTIKDNNYVNATFLVYENSKKEIDRKVKIKIRGNSTAALHEKKPYEIKFNEDVNISFNKKEPIKTNKLILLGDVGTTIKQPIGINVSRFFGQEWEPSYQYVNLILNGRYRGCYILSETINEAKKHIDFDDYLAEYDVYYWNSNNHFFRTKFTPINMGYTIKHPYYNEKIIERIERDINEYENDLFEENKLEKIDIESFASWLLIHDLLGTYDAYGTNLFFYSKNGKLFLGPCWDFGCTLAKTNNWSGMHYNNQLFNIYKLLDNNQYCFSYRKIWNDKMDDLLKFVIKAIDREIVPIKDDLEKSWKLDLAINKEDFNKSWQFDEASYNIGKNIDQVITDTINYFGHRISWMNNHVDNLKDNLNICDIKTDKKDDFVIVDIQSSITNNKRMLEVWKEDYDSEHKLYYFNNQDEIIFDINDILEKGECSIININYYESINGKDELIVKNIDYFENK